MATYQLPNQRCLWFPLFRGACTLMLKRRLPFYQAQWCSRYDRQLDVGDMQWCVHWEPLEGETLHGATFIKEDGARLDIAANGFWGGRYERAFFDVRVFNPHAPSNRQESLPQTYRKHECVKICAYEEGVREIEHGSFTSLVMSPIFWRIGERCRSMPQTCSLNTQWKVGPSIQYNSCLDEI